MSGFDRIKTPERRLLERDMDDPHGRAALFTGGGEGPVSPGLRESLDGVAVHCSRCGAVSRLDLATALRSALPLFLVAPWRDHPVFAVCPAGRHRAWLRPQPAEDAEA